MKKLFFTLMFLLICTPAHAVVTYYLCSTSAGGNWNSTTIWTTIQDDGVGCTGGTGNYPGSVTTDIAIMDGKGGSVASQW